MNASPAKTAIVHRTAQGDPPSACPQGIYLISPSGAVVQPEALDLAQQRLRSLGFAVIADRDVLTTHQRFAGTDAQRLGAIRRALKQPLPFVMMTRGGYGLGRLLPSIDWRAVANSGKNFIGYSDFTAFSLALLARTGAGSFSGPAALADFGGHATENLTQTWFVRTLRGELDVLRFACPDADPVDAHGVLWGGNLALISALLGTPYFPKVDGGILFLEDVGEHPYRIERMLVQLWQAGVLAAQKAIVLGQFTQYRLAAHDRGYDLNTVIQWLRHTVKVPVVPGLPYGHVKVKATLPVGRRVGITSERGVAQLFLDLHA